MLRLFTKKGEILNAFENQKAKPHRLRAVGRRIQPRSVIPSLSLVRSICFARCEEITLE